MLLTCMMMVNVNTQASEERPAGLQDLRWKYRVILIFANEPYLSNALTNLDEFKTEITLDQPGSRNDVWSDRPNAHATCGGAA